jgi:hypothetical protein
MTGGRSCLLRGNSPATLPVELQEYSKRWNELKISHGAVCLSEKAVIPRFLRPKVLQFLHLNHFGVNKDEDAGQNVLLVAEEG